MGEIDESEIARKVLNILEFLFDKEILTNISLTW